MLFSRPTSQYATKFGLQYQERVLMLNCRGHADHVTKSVSKWRADVINCWEQSLNSFKKIIFSKPTKQNATKYGLHVRPRLR